MLTSPPAFLVEHLPARPHNPERPHVTVTWAQSLDAKIAGPGGARVILSGPESMEMTHWLRTMHDAILVGINTIIMDDPRLKIQLVPQDDPSLLPPQPLILDPQLRFPLSARILSEWNNYVNCRDSRDDRDDRNVRDARGPAVVRQPWIVCGDTVPPERREEVERAGARVVPTRLDGSGRISPNALPAILSSLGLGSVMIEGGSRILSSFLHAPSREDGSPLVDSVIVTVAPMFIGEGVGVVPEGEDRGLPPLRTVHTETMGKDAVMLCALR
ncbi:hypothetical protein JCM24511_05883 [Saitozyma sp. JCM 24511]|nr:hypothetical protein JCM24511_05883 [Saitozyma sp. JCM 24511]